MVRLCFKICSLLCLCSPAFAYEDLVIDDWRTTIDNDTCWMTAHPFDQSGSEASRHFNENIRFNILFPYGSPDPQFSIYTNQIEKHNEEVFVSLGSGTYVFEVITDHAYSKDTNDRDILFQMLKGDKANFVLKVGESESTPLLSISLSGFKDAYNYISKKCNFYKMPSIPLKFG
ncbi:hypothetical protein OAC90_00210 [Planktomarina sp.]|nr:hypothetical protein [Planktomarina sp.]